MKIIKSWFTNGKTMCDCCGRYITNVYHLEYDNGVQMAFGSTCIERQYKERKHNKTSEKDESMKYAKYDMKCIKNFEKMLEIIVNGTEKDCNAFGYELTVPNFQEHDTWDLWYGKTFEDWKDWKIRDLKSAIDYNNELLTAHLNKALND